MAKKLVIVESPSKAKTIKGYLGSGYDVAASMGHLRDLPKSQLGVDTENDFEPRYITIRGKGPLITELKKKAKAADKILLATDPAREGEAISWHLAILLGVDPASPCRVTFTEVTKSAVRESVKHPRAIDLDLVDAQQARRVLDRIVGYKISPLLWKKVKKGLSAGRVQSATTRLVVDREAEIQAFVPVEYWSIDAKLTDAAGKHPFTAKFLGDRNGRKIDLPDAETVEKIKAVVDKADYSVKSVKKSEKKRSPAPPFTTSTLQQEASRKLNFTSRRTMGTAQQLYEGVSIKGRGTVGLITYMRTDSTRIAADAQASARAYILEKYGAAYVPGSPRVYKSKSGAQDAHEAIRPTDPTLSPADVKDSLTSDQFRLYRLVWERFTASQMSSAVLDTVQADIAADLYTFRASGTTVKFDGFTAVYVEGRDEEEEKKKKLPPLEEGQELKLRETVPEQHFTQPPPRYTEASLVKAMEEAGIGRPSTYAPTITTITSRGYVSRSGKTLVPTELGTIVTELMKENFKDIVDTEFTAKMETELDDVERGNTEWKSIIREFYTPFEKTLALAEEKIGDIEIKDEESDVRCEKCGRMMVYKQGRFGKFLACPGYPECKNTKSITKELGVACPKCGGKVLVKKSKRGTTYYGCEHNPTCDYMSWDEPTNEKCPKCGSMLVKRRPYRGKNFIKTVCVNEECGWEKKPEKKGAKTEKETDKE